MFNFNNRVGGQNGLLLSILKTSRNIQTSDIDNLNGMISLKDKVLTKMKKNQNHNIQKICLVSSSGDVSNTDNA